MKRAKYIYNIQDFNPEQVLAVSYSKNKLITGTMMLFDKFSCRPSNLVITVGRDLVETMNTRFIGKKVPKTVMINNWINEKEVYPVAQDHPEVTSFREQYGLDGKYVILYFGNIYVMIVAFIMTFIAVYLHRGNIKRLISGTERKLGQKE